MKMPEEQGNQRSFYRLRTPIITKILLSRAAEPQAAKKKETMGPVRVAAVKILVVSRVC